MTDPGQPQYGQPQYGQPQYGQPQYGQPQYGGPYAAPQTSQDAVIALILAVGGWVLCPVILSVAALVYSGRAQRAIAASGGALTGSGLATAATVIAWVGIMVSVVFLLFVLLFVATFHL